MRTMNLDGARAYSQLDGSLLAGSADHELPQYFAFAPSQRFATGQRRDPIECVAVCPPAARANRSLHARRNRAATKGLFDEIEGAMLDGFDGHGDVALARDHEDGRRVRSEERRVGKECRGGWGQ